MIIGERIIKICTRKGLQGSHLLLKKMKIKIHVYICRAKLALLG